MQQEANNARQLVVERIRQSTNILVAVSTNPSVDALAAALGLSLLLNKLDKHATAVFSGQMPPAMSFLDPDKTFESSVDGLRDFIISLDKEKADRLRYKVEDDVVKIFITPYRTVLSDKDLQFSQGELNVELVIALGVDKREDLDKAIVAHGRILHDATVVTINASNQRTSLGTVDLHDPNASSLCEMLISLTESLQQPGLLDAQISTALLTGIVAATERFSNEHTTPKVMTMAAQLMAAGANQQLIATNLRNAHAIPDTASSDFMPMQQNTSADSQPIPSTPKSKKDGELDISHEASKDQKEDKGKSGKRSESKQKQPQEPKNTAVSDAEAALAAALPAVAADAPSVYDQLKNAIEAAPSTPKQEVAPPLTTEPAPLPELPKPAEKPTAPGEKAVNGTETSKPQEEDFLSSHASWKGKRLEPPTLGGSLSATAQQALDDKLKAEEKERNFTLLSHNETSGEPADANGYIVAKPAPEPTSQQDAAPTLTTEPVSLPEPTPPVTESQPAPALPYLPEPPPLAAMPVPAPVDLNAAREAVDAALSAQPADPTQPLPVPQSESLPPAASFDSMLPQQPQSTNGQPDMPPPLPPLPPMPPLPTHNDATLSPLPDMPDLPPPAPMLPDNQTPSPVQPPAAPNDPGQFKIPS